MSDVQQLANSIHRTLAVMKRLDKEQADELRTLFVMTARLFADAEGLFNELIPNPMTRFHEYPTAIDNKYEEWVKACLLWGEVIQSFLSRLEQE